MEINRRKFLNKSLLVSGISLAGYSVGGVNFLTKPITQPESKTNKYANYKNTKHTRNYYRSAKF